MPEHVKPSAQPPSHAHTLRADALRLLSRSPKPYHRQQFELSHAAESLSKAQSSAPSRHHTDDEDSRSARPPAGSYHESTNSESGTEADDEHFLKGLPAPRLRLHKGLRGADVPYSNTPSPQLSPTLVSVEVPRISGAAVFRPSASANAIRQSQERTTRKRRNIEILRRTIELGLLWGVAGILCLKQEVWRLLIFWGKELVCQTLVIGSLLAIYPLRLLLYRRKPWKSVVLFTIPASFDPAPLFYPPAITMLVASLLSVGKPIALLPSMILSLSTLPKQLIPAIGGAEGRNVVHWFLATMPLFVAELTGTLNIISNSEGSFHLSSEVLTLIYPLHQALCVTLHYLTTTSLLPAELQLLSTASVNLLLLASSPQATILKALLWGGSIGLLLLCSHVLRWGVALARVPKWRFKRADYSTRSLSEKGNLISWSRMLFGLRGRSVFARDAAGSGSSEEDTTAGPNDRKRTESLSYGPQKEKIQARPRNEAGWVDRRRHTLSSLPFVPQRSSNKTPSGRRKRSSSESLKAFFHLTYAQAVFRKWLYAGWVYICVLGIILVGIREYISTFSLNGYEPVGWALGYLLGDLPRFRLEVVKANLQRWILLPTLSHLVRDESCDRGWVEHLRQASFGEANTRLIISAYWLAVIVVGLAVVFRLSAVYEVDTRRKVFHFMMVAMLLPATYVDPNFAALALILMLAIFLLLDLFRASQLPPLSKSLAHFLTPYVDGRDLKGPVVISHIFLLIGCAIPLWLSLGSLPRTGQDALMGWEVPSREVSMVSGVICVGMGDAAASLIGRRYGRHKWIWGGGKSIEGSVAFAAAVGSALLLAKAWLRIGGWVANNDNSWALTMGKAGVAAGIASLTEAVLTGGNDNVVVPVVLWLCVKGLDV